MQKMMVMIREIKQAARRLLEWLFDDWMELSGHGDKTLQFIFNDLDPSDAVDFKKLLIELYDRKLISRSSLQIKMDLDPDIETSNREKEKLSVDLMDGQQVKPIVDMVIAGILSVESAQKMLGIKTGTGGNAQASLNITARANGAVCRECTAFDKEACNCPVIDTKREPEAKACRFFDKDDNI